MVMNIERGFNEYSKQANLFANKKADASTQAQAKHIANVNNKVSVFNFSEIAQKLNKPTTNVDDKVDMERVQALKSKLDKGEYHVDIDKLVDKVADELSHK